ncbi:MAG: GNAT family acetyltransferase [Hyphomicrobiaceae bacterium]|nr:MAG: GNAT family acetyltransferase [Hyphomicrobiaceae bacterium]
MEIASYREEHFAGIKALWAEVNPDDRPWNSPEIAIPMKMSVQPELFLVALEEGNVVGTTMAGFDGHRGWLHLVAVKPSHRRRGIATRLLQEAERRLEALGCPKINLQVLAGNTAAVNLYKSLGFDVEERVSMSRRIGRFRGASHR